jgi:hypothetical protein
LHDARAGARDRERKGDADILWTNASAAGLRAGRRRPPCLRCTT